MITAIVAAEPIDREVAIQFDFPVIEKAGFVIVPLDPNHSNYWAKQLQIENASTHPIILDCPMTRHFASNLFVGRPYAIIDTEYFGGDGDQAAAVYAADSTVQYRSERTGMGPINEALRMIGVRATGTGDEFDTLELSSYRDFSDLFEKYWELQ